MPHPGRVLGVLAGGDRLRVFAACVLAPDTVDGLASAAGVTPAAARRSLDALAGAGLVAPLPRERWAAVPDALAVASRQLSAESSRRRAEADLAGFTADPNQLREIRGFVAGGRVTHLPAQLTKRLTVLDVIAQRFEPGRTYEEAEVNRLLREIYHDHAELRRALVDHGFLERREGAYWRAGGRFEV